MHAVFLYHAMQAGMDFGIVNPATKVTYSDIPDDQLAIIEDVILNKGNEATDKLLALAYSKKAKLDAEKALKAEGKVLEKAPEEDAWRKENVESRLRYALRKGLGAYLDADIHEALEKYPKAVDVIEGPLMAGMNEVGKLFGEGKMFLPQVVKTARTMKQAVSILQPYLEQEKTSDVKTAGKVVMATVKGDVHDIGKNIVSVVMACNNFQIIDLGVMVPPEKIIETVIKENADMVCLSGLITPSLDEMVNVARELKNAGLNVPMIVGGATTSELHVALKIAPEYEGIVVWSKDAAYNAVLATLLMNPAERIAMKQELDERYASLREEYKAKKENLLSIEEARKHKLNLFE